MSDNPISTDAVQCVGVICFRGNDVLLIKRGTAPRKGEWSIPGGRIEVGETDAEAALRELFEETGVSADLSVKIDIIKAEFEGVLYHLHDFAALWLSGEPTAGDDAAEAKFVAMDDIVALKMWPETETIIQRAYAHISEQKSFTPRRGES